MADPTTKPVRMTTRHRKPAESVLTDTQAAEFDRIVTTMMAEDAKLSDVAKALESAGIPRSRSGRTDWTSGWIRGVASRRGLLLSR